MPRWEVGFPVTYPETFPAAAAAAAVKEAESGRGRESEGVCYKDIVAWPALVVCSHFLSPEQQVAPDNKRATFGRQASQGRQRPLGQPSSSSCFWPPPITIGRVCAGWCFCCSSNYFSNLVQGHKGPSLGNTCFYKGVVVCFFCPTLNLLSSSFRRTGSHNAATVTAVAATGPLLD